LTQTTENTTQVGHILVRVSVQNEFQLFQPGKFIRVSISELKVFGGVFLQPVTNESGELEIPLPPDHYSVTIQEPKFQLGVSVLIVPQRTTELGIFVNRTVYDTVFVEMQDPYSSHAVLQPQTIEAAVLPKGWGDFQMTFNCCPIRPIIIGNSSPPPPKFGQIVYLRTIIPLPFVPRGNSSTSGIVSYLWTGNEIRAEVLSQRIQDPSEALLWVTLRPVEVLNITNGETIDVVTYTPTYKVTILGG
jgi:hypothetical protein